MTAPNAIDNFESMLAKGNDSSLLRYSLGSEYLKQKSFDKAIEHLGRAIEMDKQYSAAWKLYGKALSGAARYSEAVDALQQGIRVAEDKGDIQAAKEMSVFLKRARKALEQADAQ